MREILRKLPYDFRQWFRYSRLGELIYAEKWMS